MRFSPLMCMAITATIVMVADAQAQSPAKSGGTEQPPMTSPTPPAPVVKDQPGGKVLAVKPPRGPAPVTHDPASSMQPPLPCRDGPFRATINGRSRTLTGHYCEQPDGTWAPAS